jgi:dual specificity phosphatase 12
MDVGLPPSDNANQILPGIWLGNLRAAQDEAFLRNAGIQVVFNCTKDAPFHSSIRRRYRVPVDDNLESDEIRNLELWGYEIVYKMLQELKEGRTLYVHCHAGMQRSPAVVAMFLIAVHKMSTDQAKAYIKQRRPIAFFPSANFEKAMRGFERSLRKNLIEGIE